MNETNKPINDGGPAFPLSPEIGRAHFDDPFAYHGMTLRDYFASDAMKGRLASGRYDSVGTESFNAETINALARISFKIADAMLAERSKGQP